MTACNRAIVAEAQWLSTFHGGLGGLLRELKNIHLTSNPIGWTNYIHKRIIRHTTDSLAARSQGLEIMASTKTKTVVAGVMVSAVIVSAVAVKWLFFPSIKDEYFKSDYREFQKVPDNLLVVRPTRFSLPSRGTIFSSYTREPSGPSVVRQMGRNVSLERVMAMAYQCNPAQVVAPATRPPGNFDFLVTVPDPSRDLFKAAIQKQLGYAAHWETRHTGVLLLETPTPHPSGLKVSTAKSGNVSFNNGRYEFTHARLGSLMGFCEQYLDRPVLDRTGLTDFYDFLVKISWPIPGDPDPATVEKILEGLGLKLEPGNEAVQMLVVEKAR
jgi:uncharacterized protein (TIGR03435 family)